MLRTRQCAADSQAAVQPSSWFPRAASPALLSALPVRSHEPLEDVGADQRSCASDCCPQEVSLEGAVLLLCLCQFILKSLDFLVQGVDTTFEVFFPLSGLDHQVLQLGVEELVEGCQLRVRHTVREASPHLLAELPQVGSQEFQHLGQVLVGRVRAYLVDGHTASYVVVHFLSMSGKL